MLEVAKEKEIPLNIIYVNCKLKRVADTEYRLIAQIISDLGLEVPATGLPTDEIYKIFISLIEKKKQILILILDEIDHLIKKTGDAIIYNLTRLNSSLKNAQISIIGISNDILFIDKIDPRVKSSLSEEDVIFHPYNALQLQKILKERAKIAFKKDVIAEGVIEKCAAYAAREHGDARRAIELLRVAAELAERQNSKKVFLKHIDQAEQKIEKDRVVDIIKSQPKQHQLVLYSMIILDSKRNDIIYTGDVYSVYLKLCQDVSIRPLTQRRISDIIAELDMLGIINARVISKGRMGRTREITMAIPQSLKISIKKILNEAIF